MASTETKVLDEVIASRRALLVGGTAFAALAFAPKAAEAAATVSSYSDVDILNFALNLEYLEANYYYLAYKGTNISNNGISITGTGTQGTVTVKSNPQVPFKITAVANYAAEVAIEEGNHVNYLRNALGSSAVAQPNIDLMTSFNTLATAAGIGSTFDPFANDYTFLVGAYIFEDVGVTAYHGAAPLISTSTTGKTYLAAASSILAVEAYHAGLIRTTIQLADPTGSLGYLGYTQQISGLRSKLSLAANTSVTSSDDIGLVTGRSVTFDNGNSGQATQLVDANANAIAYSRNTTQVLNIVTGGGATTSGTKATGVFFPSGLNGTFV